MTDQHIHDLAALYALGGLDPHEVAIVEVHIATCAECRQSVDEARRVTDLFPAMLEEKPSPQIKTRLIQQARESRRRQPKVRGFSLERFGFAQIFAAVALGLSAILIVWNISLQQRVQSLEAKYAEAQAQLQSQLELATLLNTPNIRLANLNPTPSGTGTGQVLWNPQTRQAIFIITGLPPAPEGKTYQLWLIDNGTPVSVGFVQVDANGFRRVIINQLVSLQNVGAAGISIENLPGSQAPTDIVLVGNF